MDLRKILLFTFCCFVFIYHGIAGDTLQLSKKLPSIEGINTQFVVDEMSSLSVDEILEKFKLGSNFPPDSAITKFNATTGQYWLYFNLQNVDSLDNNWVLSFKDWPEVIVYEKQATGNFDQKITGFLVPYNDRNYAFANNSHVLISLKADQTKEYLVNLVAGADHWKMPLGLHFDIRQKDVQDKLNHRDELIMAFFAGIFLILFFYNLFIYISTKELEYLIYLGQILVLGYTINATAGYITSVFSAIELFPFYRSIAESIISGLSGCLLILFTMYFLNTKVNLPTWHKILKGILILIPFLIIGVNIHYTIFGSLTALTIIILTIIFITVGILSIRKKVPSAWYYLIAYLFSLFGIIVITLTVSGLLPSNLFTMNYALPTGYALELLFFSFALANKINILKKNSDEQKKEIIDHLYEKEQMQENIKIDLEQKVKERTIEIQQQKEVIEIEKQKSEDLLLNILPEEAVLELKATGTCKPKVHSSVSILFVDFIGFTNTVSTIPPDKLVYELNDIFQHFDEIVEINNTEKIKTIGDAYLAASGLYDEDDNHPHRVVQSAIDMQKYLIKRNIDSAIKWNIRIGIHSGAVISGIVGKKKFAFDIWGDTVNIASRLESECEVNKINISAYTFDLVKDSFKGRYRGKIDAKGKGEIDMYYIEYA